MLAKCLDGTRSMNLSNNAIKDAGLKMLAKHLKTNFTVTHFDARGNDITSDGAFTSPIVSQKTRRCWKFLSILTGWIIALRLIWQKISLRIARRDCRF